VIGLKERSRETLPRVGLALASLSGLLVALAPTGDVASGPARGAPATTATLDLGGGVAVIGIAGLLLLLASALAPWLWARLVGLGVATMLCLTSGLIVLAGRTSNDFAAGADISLERAGLLLALAFWVGIAGIVVVLIGFRRIAMAVPEPSPDGAPAGGAEPAVAAGIPPRPSGKATSSLVLGLAGVIGAFVSIFAFGGPLAVALGSLALGDIRASGGDLRGRGTAIAGIALGIVGLSLLIALVGAAMFAVSPD
jgi:Domain of unknown function (DUF4190)